MGSPWGRNRFLKPVFDGFLQVPVGKWRFGSRAVARCGCLRCPWLIGTHLTIWYSSVHETDDGNLLDSTTVQSPILQVFSLHHLGFGPGLSLSKCSRWPGLRRSGGLSKTVKLFKKNHICHVWTIWKCLTYLVIVLALVLSLSSTPCLNGCSHSRGGWGGGCSTGQVSHLSTRFQIRPFVKPCYSF